MNLHWTQKARKTTAFFRCLMCCYTGPLALGPNGALACQNCESGALGYLVPICPKCQVYVGVESARAAQENGGAYSCKACGHGWREG